MRRVLVVLPTYNERENISSLVPEITKQISQADILVVDDNSPDQTAALVRDMQRSEPRLFLLERERKEGLGRAYVAAFRWALKNNYDVIVQMDADYSHRVQDLRNMLSLLTPGLGFIVGSRWSRGGRIRNWDRKRWLLSWTGNFYVRTLLGAKIMDWTGGFNVWTSDVLLKIDLDKLESQGYAFQVEMKLRALRLNFPLIEVPITFEERRLGYSKMSLSIICEALVRVWRLKSKF